MGGRYLESVPDGCVQCLQEAEGALLVEEGPNNSCSSQKRRTEGVKSGDP